LKSFQFHGGDGAETEAIGGCAKFSVLLLANAPHDCYRGLIIQIDVGALTFFVLETSLFLSFWNLMLNKLFTAVPQDF
jgi:hypothetical protein